MTETGWPLIPREVLPAPVPAAKRHPPPRPASPPDPSRQLPMFGAETTEPSPADLAGLLAGPGQLGRMGGTARVSVPVDAAWRVHVLVAELVSRGLVVNWRPLAVRPGARSEEQDARPVEQPEEPGEQDARSGEPDEPDVYPDDVDPDERDARSGERDGSLHEPDVYPDDVDPDERDARSGERDGRPDEPDVYPDDVDPDDQRVRPKDSPIKSDISGEESEGLGTRSGADEPGNAETHRGRSDGDNVGESGERGDSRIESDDRNTESEGAPAGADDAVSSGPRFEVLTAYSRRLNGLANFWPDAAAQLFLSGPRLRLWVAAAGEPVTGGYALGLDPAKDVTVIDAALVRAGLAGRVSEDGTRYLIMGKRRLRRLAELVGDRPEAAPEELWPLRAAA